MKLLQYELPLSECKAFEDKRVAIDNDLGLIVKGELSDTEYSQAAGWLMASNNRFKAAKTAFDRFLGQLILHYSSVRDCSWADAISRLNLVKETSRAFKSLVKLPRIVSILPEEAFTLPNVTTTQLDVVCSYGPPEEPDKIIAFNHGRMEILKHASENSEDTSIGNINAKMRTLQSELGVAPSRRPSVDSVKLKFMQASLMLVNWSDDDFETFGVTYHQTKDHWDEYRAELLDRGILPESDIDPACFCPPWKSNVEVVDNE